MLAIYETVLVPFRLRSPNDSYAQRFVPLRTPEEKASWLFEYYNGFSPEMDDDVEYFINQGRLHLIPTELLQSRPEKGAPVISYDMTEVSVSVAIEQLLKKEDEAEEYLEQIGDITLTTLNSDRFINAYKKNLSRPEMAFAFSSHSTTIEPYKIKIIASYVGLRCLGYHELADNIKEIETSADAINMRRLIKGQGGTPCPSPQTEILYENILKPSFDSFTNVNTSRYTSASQFREMYEMTDEETIEFPAELGKEIFNENLVQPYDRETTQNIYELCEENEFHRVMNSLSEAVAERQENEISDQSKELRIIINNVVEEVNELEETHDKLTKSLHLSAGVIGAAAGALIANPFVGFAAGCGFSLTQDKIVERGSEKILEVAEPSNIYNIYETKRELKEPAIGL